MSTPGFDDLLEQGRALEARANARKGQKLNNTRSRQGMIDSIKRLGKRPDLPPGCSMIQICFIGKPEPPSIASVADLKPMLISDLRLQIRHSGRVLIVRTIGESIRAITVDSVVEDETGNFSTISVGYLHPALKGEDALPQNCIFAIKEPLLQLTMHDTWTIRIDHPSDVVCLRGNHELIPPGLRSKALAATASAYKNTGNKYYQKKRYVSALESYSAGIEACLDGEEVIRADIYRNRSLVHQLLGRYEAAVKDAYLSLLDDVGIDPDGGEDQTTQTLNSIDSGKVKAYDAKAYFRAGRANYALGRYDKAKRDFERVLELTTGDQHAISGLTDIMKRAVEAQTGEYDFAGMTRYLNSPEARLDHASFTSNVDTRDTTSKHGRGLFATRDMKAGELVLCEKAFETSHDGDSGPTQFEIIDTVSATGTQGCAVTLTFRVVDKVRYNPGLAKSLLSLPDGGYQPRHTGKHVDGQTIVDTFHVAKLVHNNNFVDSEHTGLWVTASSIAQACNGNVCRVQVGDMMIVRAARDIRKDEEITTRHTHTWDYCKQLQFLGFKCGGSCDCPLCIAEKASEKLPGGETTTVEQMIIYRDELMPLMKTYEQHCNSRPLQRNIKEIERLYEKLAATYPEIVFHDVPRLYMVVPAAWLAKAYASPDNMQKWEYFAKEGLRNQGFGVVIKANTVDIDRKHAITTIEAVTAAVHLRDVYRRLKKQPVADAFNAFARQVFQTVRVDVDRFEAEYGY